MAAQTVSRVLWVTNQHLLIVMIRDKCQGTGLGVLEGLAVWEALSNPLSSLWDSVEMVSRWRGKPIEGILCSPCWSTAPQAPQPQHSSLMHGSWTAHCGCALPGPCLLPQPLLKLQSCLPSPGCPIPLAAGGSVKGLLGGVYTEPGLMHYEMCNRVKPDFPETVFEWKQACLLFD